MFMYKLGRGAVKTLLTPFYRFEVIGYENIPKEGGVLICSNHISNFDPPVVGITAAPRQVHFMAKAELFKVPVLGPLVRSFGTFPVKRGMSDREALRVALKILKDGKILGLFPEGTRSVNGELGKGLSGAGFFALRSNAAVVPCAIIGPYKAFSRLKVVYGKPINMEELREQKASADVVTEVIMAEIKNLIEKNK